MWEPWKDALLKLLIRKWVTRLTLPKIGFRTQFWPQFIVLLLLKSNKHLGQYIRLLDSYDQCQDEFRTWGTHIDIWITVPFENVSELKKILQVFNTKDETPNNIPDELCELLVPGTHFDRLSHTHHSNWVALVKKHRTNEPLLRRAKRSLLRCSKLFGKCFIFLYLRTSIETL